MSDSEETRPCNKPQRAEEHGESYQASSNISNNYWDHRATTATDMNRNTTQTSANANSYIVNRNQTPVQLVVSSQAASVMKTTTTPESNHTSNKLNNNIISNNSGTTMMNGDDSFPQKRVSICLPNDEVVHEAGATLVPVMPMTTSESADRTYGDALMSGTNDFTG